MSQKPHLTGHCHIGAALLPKGIGGEVHDHGNQGRCLSGRAHDPLHQKAVNLFGLQIGHTCIQHSGKDLQICFLQVHGKLDPLVHHFLVGKQQHQHHTSGTCQQQLKPADSGARLPGCHGNGRQVCGLGHKLCDPFHQLIHLLHLFFDGGVDRPCFIHAQAVIHHQLIHIQPVACRRGDTACAGVRLFQIAHSGQLCHFIANGGRGILHIGKFRDGLGAYRLGGTDIQVHNALQDLFLSFGQLHKPPPLCFSTRNL